MTTRSEQFRSLALAVILSVGAGTIWTVVFMCGCGIVSSMVSTPYVYEKLLFTSDDTPIIESFTSNNYDARTYRTLDGTPVELSRDDLNDRYRTAIPGPINQRKQFINLSWSRRIADIPNSVYVPEKWYFICDGKLHGHGYVVGYDKLAKAKIGYIGLKGFRSDEPPQEEQFPVDGRKIAQHGSQSLILSVFNNSGQRDTRYLLTDNGLVQLNLKERTAKLVRKETDMITAIRLAEEQIDAETTSGGAAILLRTPDKVLVLDSSGKEIQSYLLPKELRYSTLVFVKFQGEKAFVHKSWSNHNELIWIDTTGKILEHKRVDLLARSKISNSATCLLVSFGMPSFGVITGAFTCYPWVPAETESLAYWAALSKALHKCWLIFLITGAIGVVLAVLCYRRQRKYGLPWTWAWTGFVLFFGLPAYLGYLAHRSWPARLPCPSCGEAAPRDREACFSCRQDFPAPVPKGIEVFT